MPHCAFVNVLRQMWPYWTATQSRLLSEATLTAESSTYIAFTWLTCKGGTRNHVLTTCARTRGRALPGGLHAKNPVEWMRARKHGTEMQPTLEVGLPHAP